MTDLTTVLERAAGPMPSADVAGDLARGRRALTRSRRRRGAASLLGVAAAGVLGVGAVGRAFDPAPARTVTNGPATAPTLLSDPQTVGAFTFAAPPAGWSVQASHPFGVIFAPGAGGVDKDPNSYVGKLAFYLENNEQRGEHRSFDGRDFWIRHDDGKAHDPDKEIPVVDPETGEAEQPELSDLPATTMISTRIPGRDGGSLTVQYPDSAGFTEEQMLEFLASIEVGAGAELSHG